MDSVDLQVLKTSLEWRTAGHDVILGTIVQTWGSSPRPPGAMLAIRDDGLVSGSISGGCIEDDMINKVRDQSLEVDNPTVVTYGISKEEANRFGLPCGGTLQVVLEKISDDKCFRELLTRIEQHQLVCRSVVIATGKVSLEDASSNDEISFDGEVLRCVYGPRWRLIIIGAGQLSTYVAQMAKALDYHVIVCDPRSEYADTWSVPGTVLSREMPDDLVVALKLDAHSAVVAVTHDPKLDDLALMEALKSSSFYVGALGSRLNSKNRRERLLLFDLDSSEIDRLHGPVGLRIGSKTPPEIAVSILAEITAVRNGVTLDSIGFDAGKELTEDATSTVCAV
ncbi:MAG: XdhC family protein [Proteobacteria bacterium]|nr:XdhC family protein [Pseudomonadota bacterium]